MQRLLVLFLMFAVSFHAEEEFSNLYEAIAGKWEGKQTFHSHDWWPQGKQGTAEVTFKKVLDGKFIESHLVSKVANEKPFVLKSMSSWNSYTKQLHHWEFDNMGFGSYYMGKIAQKAITLVHKNKDFSLKVTYTLLDKNHFQKIVYYSQDGKSWKNIITGDFKRVSEGKEQHTPEKHGEK
ncbi:DUF1579 family protein [Candidatus Uabimicrobium amorphum]|nr:DUF1579 family protein [Candidatus Uabimicrobium amorphum]